MAGILKQFLRDLPECIFTTAAYNRLFEAYAITDQELRQHTISHSIHYEIDDIPGVEISDSSAFFCSKIFKL